MTRSSTPRKLGASILLSIAAGTMPLSGCVVIGQPEPAEEVSAEEQRLYEAAISQGDPVLVERYLRRYPDGRVRSVLAAQPPEVLSRLSASAFADVPASELDNLPASIRQNLPASVVSSATVARPSRDNSGDRSEDTYSG